MEHEARPRDTRVGEVEHGNGDCADGALARPPSRFADLWRSDPECRRLVETMASSMNVGVSLAITIVESFWEAGYRRGYRDGRDG